MPCNINDLLSSPSKLQVLRSTPQRYYSSAFARNISRWACVEGAVYLNHLVRGAPGSPRRVRSRDIILSCRLRVSARVAARFLRLVYSGIEKTGPLRLLSAFLSGLLQPGRK